MQREYPITHRVTYYYPFNATPQGDYLFTFDCDATDNDDAVAQCEREYEYAIILRVRPYSGAV